MGKIMDKLREITSERYRISARLKAIFVLVFILVIGISLLVGGIIVKRGITAIGDPGEKLYLQQQLWCDDGTTDKAIGDYLGASAVAWAYGTNDTDAKSAGAIAIIYRSYDPNVSEHAVKILVPWKVLGINAYKEIYLQGFFNFGNFDSGSNVYCTGPNGLRVLTEILPR